MEKYLQEAFKAFDEIDTLNEDVFDISINDGLDKAKEFEEEPVWDDREEEIIIDPLAETEEDLQKDYVGKAILQCEICQSMVYKDPSEVVIDEESELANLEDICPFCQSQDGFKVIGEIKEFCDDEECEEEHKEEVAEEPTEEKPEEEVEVSSEEEVEKPAEDEDLEEAIRTRKKVRTENLKEAKSLKAKMARKAQKDPLDDIDADADDKKEKAKKKFAKAKDDADSDRDYKLKKKGLKEDFQKVDIETDTQKMSMESDENGKVTVTTEPKEEQVAEAGAEVIAPVSDEVKAEFKSSEEEPEEIDYDFDEFEEKDFDSLGEGFLKKVYENVKSFKTTEGRLSGNQLMLEGLITFKSGKQAKTNFVFEAYKATKTGKLKFLGENKQFAKGKKSFTLSGKADGKKLVCESLNYNYVAKAQDGSSKRLYGTIKK